MSSIDNRIVSMEFNNENFENRISDTIASLDRLSETINYISINEGLGELSQTSGQTASAVENISNKFSALGAIGFAAIQKLTHSLIDFVGQAAGDILEPIITGGKQRSMNIEQAKFMFRGLGIDVEDAMKSSLDAVRGTAYGLDEAAKAAAQFGASGMKTGEEMTRALSGIAGSAAMTGRGFSEMADIFTSSAATGVVNTQDLQQFATRGLNAAAAIAKVLGKTEVEIRRMASEGELDFKTFSAAMATAFGEHAKRANEKYAGSLANVKAAMSRLGASFIGPRLELQRDLFNALSPVIDKVAESMKPVIDIFTHFGRIRTDNIVKFLGELNFESFTLAMSNFAATIGNIFRVIGEVIKPFKEAFREIFPPTTESILVKISEILKTFTDKLIIGGETAAKLKRVFSGFFAVIEIGWTIFKELFSIFINLIGSLSGAGGGILDFTAKIGDSLTELNKKLVEGGGIKDFFIRVGELATIGIAAIKNFIDVIRNFFSSFNGGDEAEAVLGRVESRLDNVHSTFERFTTIPPGLVKFFEEVKLIFEDVWDYIKTWFSELGSKIADAFKPGDFNAAIDILNVGLLGGIALMIKKFIDGGLLQFAGVDGLMEKINGIFDGVTGQLEAMQAALRSEALLKIAIAIGILAASILVLSLIDSADLAKALTAMAVGFGQLAGVMAILNTIGTGPRGAATLGIISGVMIAIAGAMVILAGAIKILSTIDPGDMATALVGLGVGLGILVTSMLFISTNAAGLLLASTAMIAISTSLIVLAGALKLFATMSWTELAKGFSAVAVGLGIIVVAMNLMPIGPTIAAGAAMIPLAIGISILAGAVKLFSLISWGEMLKGMVGIAAALVIIAGAMHLMPLTLPLTAAGLLLVSVALTAMAGAVLAMGAMDLGTLAKGIGSIAAMLVILAVGMAAMQGALAGATALTVAASALYVLAMVLEKIGKLSITQLVTGLAGIAAVLFVLAVAVGVLTPVIPALMGLGIALGIVGLSFALFGVGAILVAKAFETMAKAGRAGIVVLIDVIEMLITALPRFVAALIKSLVEAASELIAAAPLFLRLVTALLVQILDTVIELVPKIAEAISAFIDAAIILLRAKFPVLLETGYVLLMELLRGIRDNMGQVSTLAIEILINFINTIIANTFRIVNAGIDLLLSFLGAIANRAGEIATAGLNVLLAFIKGIADNIFLIIETVGTIITTFITTLAGEYQNIINAGVNAIVSFIKGIGDSVNQIITAATDVIILFIKGLQKNANKLIDAGFETLITFLNGLAESIRTNTPLLMDAGWNIASAIIEGMVKGIADKAGDVAGGLIDMGKGAVGGLTGFLGANSPSKLFIEIGKSMIEGLVYALHNDNTAKSSAISHAEGIVNAFQASLNRIPDSLSGMEEFNPVITPVLDLTRIQSASRNISGYMNVPDIMAGASYDKANLIAKTTELDTTATQPPVYTGPSEVKFEQNIYAPSALSTNDIYRNTKSQIALAKEELNIP